mgnify:CR=1 FL=1
MVSWFGSVQVSKILNGSVLTLSNRTELVPIVSQASTGFILVFKALNVVSPTEKLENNEEKDMERMVSKVLENLEKERRGVSWEI